MTWWDDVSDDVEVAHYRGRALARVREQLRVARHRSRDRRLLAENARAARQEAFALVLGEAADACEEIVRALEARVRAMERSGPASAAAPAGFAEAA